MRFLNPDDDKRLNRMVTEGAIVRETLEKAVGDRTVSLIDALIEYRDRMPAAPWIAWGVRQGFTRVNGVRVTKAFVRDLGMDSAGLNALAKAWLLPFAKNAYGQLLVAAVPGYQAEGELVGRLGESPVLCVATFQELADLRDAYRAAAA